MDKYIIIMTIGGPDQENLASSEAGWRNCGLSLNIRGLLMSESITERQPCDDAYEKVPSSYPIWRSTAITLP